MYNSNWYNSLNSPALSPPVWFFAPVWILLYLLMLISLVFFIVEQNEDKGLGYFYFAFQLILNIIWSPIFFIAKNILFALVVLCILDIFVILTICKFYQVSKLSAWLLIPYFVWILFASYLNLGYFVLN